MIYYNTPVTPKNATEAIRTYIQQFTGSDEYKMYTAGAKYYSADNIKINDRRKLIWCPTLTDDGKEASYMMDDPYSANNKMVSSYLKILVDQKNQYLLGNAVNLGDDDADIKESLGRRSHKKLKQIAKSAAKKSIGWAYVYVDDKGDFKFLPIDPEEFIPMYKIDNPEELAAGIRFYQITVVDDKGKAGIVVRVEFWDETMVTYYQEIQPNSNSFRLCTDEEIGAPNPHMHFVKTEVKAQETKVTDSQSWGAVPFIPLYNNDEQLYDLKAVKSYIDAYDFVMSDFANNLEDFQDVYWILKGYSGQNFDTFLEDLRRFKTMNVDGDGGASAETIEIPHEARDIFLQRINADIFKFGMGVDIESLAGGSNVTNVMIKSKYANLDLKTDEFETEVTDFIEKLIWFLNKHQEMTNGTVFEDYKVTYDRTLIINEVEMLNANAAQNGNVSDDTRLKNHAWVTDVETEKEELNADRGIVLNDG